jgi:hypothetical protein
MEWELEKINDINFKERYSTNIFSLENNNLIDIHTKKKTEHDNEKENFEKEFFLIFGGNSTLKSFNDLQLIKKVKEKIDFVWKNFEVKTSSNKPPCYEGCSINVFNQNKDEDVKKNEEKKYCNVKIILFGGKIKKNYSNDVWVLKTPNDNDGKLIESVWNWEKIKINSKNKFPKPREGKKN